MRISLGTRVQTCVNLFCTRVTIGSIRFQGFFNVRLAVEDNSQVYHSLHLEKLTLAAERNSIE